MGILWFILAFIVVVILLGIAVYLWMTWQDDIVVQHAQVREFYDFPADGQNRVLQLDLPESAKVDIQGNLLRHKVDQGIHEFYLLGDRDCTIVVDRLSSGLVYQANLRSNGFAQNGIRG